MNGESAHARNVRPAPARRTPRPLKKAWLGVRRPLAESRFTKFLLTELVVRWLRLVRATNRIAPGSTTLFGDNLEHEPGIIAFWHGQHLAAPVFYPNRRKAVAMVSRSADAEINAMVLERLGMGTVRGSGGRGGRQKMNKGGARALLALKKALLAGNNVSMIADIPNGTPREAGMGIIMLARISGRPIAPCAVATSRRHVIERSWDRTTINLPFGRCARVSGPLIYVPADADEAEMERKRQELTLALNAATARAYALADGVAPENAPGRSGAAS
jgi:lysophospholipid acyltransferase (LPLAT)-like uncharacterized protein